MARKKKISKHSPYLYLTTFIILLSILVLFNLNARQTPLVNQVTTLPAPVIVPVASPVPADLNQDGIVNLYDLNILRASVGSQGQDLPGDLNLDNLVDRRDEALLKRSYAR